jgi:integrase
MRNNQNVIDIRKKKGSSKDKALTPNERDQLRKNLTEDREKVILYLGAFAGLRADEITHCNFSWLERTEYNEKDLLAITVPSGIAKSNKQRTTYVFDIDAQREIYYFMKYQKEGLKITRRTIHNIIKQKFVPIIGRDLSTHALRASASNYFVFEMQFPDSVVQTMLGHADIRTTHGHYLSKTRASVESFLKSRL